MHRLIPAWLIQLTWFVAGVFATGAVWFFLSRNEVFASSLSAFGAVAITLIAIALHWLGDKDRRYRSLRASLGSHLEKCSALLNENHSGSPPTERANEWIDQVSEFLAKDLDQSYVARFHNFSGITFYSDGSERSNVRNALQGRAQRLQEFLQELSK